MAVNAVVSIRKLARIDFLTIRGDLSGDVFVWGWCIAPTESLFEQPLHPYTEALLSAVPVPDPRLRSGSARIRLQGEVADPSNPPSGCAFHPRCLNATKKCEAERPKMREIREGHQVAYHHADRPVLRGVAKH